MKRKYETQVTSYESQNRFGSALILTVVLTSMLAIVGVLFLLVARLDKMATSAISENKELNLAVETAIAKISQELVLDVPGVAGQEYYDYPDSKNAWLACLEPYQSGSNYYWRQISNITGTGVAWTNLQAKIIDDHQTSIAPGLNADADGDGVADSNWVIIPDMTSSKGKPIYVAVRVVDNGGMINVNTAFRSPQGKISLPGDPDPDWDGSMLSHVNLGGIISVTDSTNGLDANTVQMARYGAVPMPPMDYYRNDIQYEYDVARRLYNPKPGYLPFDIGDELDLRNRFFLRSPASTRIGIVWPVTFNPGPGQVGKQIPYMPGEDISNWYDKVTGPNPSICNRRHLSTACSFDRVIRSDVDLNNMPLELLFAWDNWMNNVGRDRAQVCIADIVMKRQPIGLLAAAIWLGLPATTPLPGFELTPNGYSWATLTRTDLACQLAVNLVDYIDIDPNISQVSVDVGGVVKTYFGYEQKNVYISEIAVAKYNDGTGSVVTYYALELYNPDPVNSVDLTNWKLVINGAPLNIGIGFTVPAAGTLIIVDNAAAGGRFNVITPSVLLGLVFRDDDHLTLLDTSGRPVDAIYTGTVSGIQAPPGVTTYNITRGNWFIDNNVPVWDTTKNRWNSGHDLGIFSPDTGTFPQNRARIQVSNRDDDKLPTIGEIFCVLGIGACSSDDRISNTYQTLPEWFNAYRSGTGTDLTDITAGKIDSIHINFVNLLRFLTLFNPFSDSVDNDGNGKSDNPGADGVDNDGDGYIDVNEAIAAYTEFSELAVAGRININTAPWFVIAQLPWVTDPTLAVDNPNRYNLAQAIVAYRDKLQLLPNVVDYSGGRARGMWDLTATIIPISVREETGFANITELINVTHNLAEKDPNVYYNPLYDIQRYGRDGVNLSGPPDYTVDIIPDDLEERDLIFSRISNLITVRSDVFTAYILVRIGTDGPQKRVIAILDRSNVNSLDDKVKVVALHPVPDPR